MLEYLQGLGSLSLVIVTPNGTVGRKLWVVEGYLADTAFRTKIKAFLSDKNPGIQECFNKTYKENLVR